MRLVGLGLKLVQPGLSLVEVGPTRLEAGRLLEEVDLKQLAADCLLEVPDQQMVVVKNLQHQILLELKNDQYPDKSYII